MRIDSVHYACGIKEIIRISVYEISRAEPPFNYIWIYISKRKRAKLRSNFTRLSGKRFVLLGILTDVRSG